MALGPEHYGFLLGLVGLIDARPDVLEMLQETAEFVDSASGFLVMILEFFKSRADQAGAWTASVWIPLQLRTRKGRLRVSDEHRFLVELFDQIDSKRDFLGLLQEVADRWLRRLGLFSLVFIPFRHQAVGGRTFRAAPPIVFRPRGVSGAVKWIPEFKNRSRGPSESSSPAQWAALCPSQAERISCLAVSLRDPNRSIGVLAFYRKREEGRFTPSENRIATLLARYVSHPLQNLLEREREREVCGAGPLQVQPTPGGDRHLGD
jgi:hypothetical protein